MGSVGLNDATSFDAGPKGESQFKSGSKVLKIIMIPKPPKDNYALPQSSTFVFEFSPGRALRFHLLLIAAVVTCSAINTLLHLTYGTRLINFLFVDSERNLPTLFSAIMLIEAAVLLLALFAVERRKASGLTVYWLFLTLLFFLMAADEVVQGHEKLIPLFRNRFGFSGVLYFAWLVPAIPFVLAVAGFYIRFLRVIERRIAMLFVLSGAIYLTGAVGFEMAAGVIVTHFGRHTALYMVETHLEETLEMMGAAVFIYSLLTAMKLRGIHWAVVETQR